MKILYLTNIPSPYRVDFFNELGKECDLTVLFERKSALDRNKEWYKNDFLYFDGIFLKGYKTGTESALCLEVIKYLTKDKYDIILIGGYSTPTGMLAINYLKLKKIPFILNVDGGLIKKESRIKYKLKKYFINSAYKWLCSGKKALEYLEHYGAHKDDIYIYPFTSLKEVDILDKTLDENQKSNLKKQLNIKEKTVILSVGRFIYIKGFDLLLKAAKELNKEFGIYIIGGNPTKEYLIQKNDFGLKNVHFLNFKSKEDLKQYYKAADLFVLPTRGDIWGLVINEAMAYGLPIITTDRCGAGIELINNKNNGFIILSEDKMALSKSINIISSNEKLRLKMAKNSLKKIKYYTIEKMAKIHIEIFKNLLENRKKEIF